MKQTDEEIFEAIWKADEEGDSTLEGIRRCCDVEVSEATIDQLVESGLISRDNGRIVLTYEGRNEARSVVRRHRLAESLLATVLDLDVDKREEIACQVEHTLLPEVEESICTLLGHPSICPDGKPIPPGRCCSTKQTTASTVVVNLTSLSPGEQGRVSYIQPKNHARLHRLTSFGLTPGTVVQVHQRSPAFCIRFEGTELALDREVAEDIFVTRIE